MRDDLIKQIASMDDIARVVVLTHNIDFLFLQNIFLAALRRSGHPGLTVFADAQCAAESYRFQSQMISGLGKHFRVVPVAMASGYRFHPKAVLLAGSKEASLFVGSGNMTYGGMRHNGEIWRRFDTKKNQHSAFAAFRRFLSGMKSRMSLGESIEIDIAEIFDDRQHAWVSELGEPDHLIGHLSDESPLIDQIADITGQQHIHKITACSPYFDMDCDALRQLSARFGNPPTEVLVQSGRSTLYKEAASQLPGHISVRSIGYSNIQDEDQGRQRFIHAKLFAFETDDDVLIVAGSANCSRAALLRGGIQGNAELMAVERMSKELFAEQLLGDLVFTPGAPELLSREQAKEEQDQLPPHIHLLAARFDENMLRVGYRAQQDIRITECIVDGKAVPFTAHGGGELHVPIGLAPATIMLQGALGDDRFSSNILWVDDEASLRTTSARRAMADHVRRGQASGEMRADDWALIVELFAKDIDYSSARELRGQGRQQAVPQEGGMPIFTRSDVFSSSYDREPDVTDVTISLPGGRLGSIFDMLLHAFGVESSPLTNAGADEDVTDDENTVDKRINLQKLTASISIVEKEPDIDARTRRKVQQAATLIAEAFTDSRYLENRDPKRLGTDMQIAGLLLRKGLSRGWIDLENFFDITQKIWSSLFFSSSADRNAGWLSVRYQRADDKGRFVAAISTPQLAATLYAWATAAPLVASGSHGRRFILSHLLGIGQLQWLWEAGDEDETYRYILRILHDSPCDADDGLDIHQIHQRRINWLRQGAALVRLQESLAQDDVRTLKARISDQHVAAGDVLWQGRKGLCIVQGESPKSKTAIMAACLQDAEVTSFETEWLIPLKQLIKPGVLPATEQFGDKQRETIAEILTQLSI